MMNTSNWREFYTRFPAQVGWLVVGLIAFIVYLLWLYGFSARWHDSHATLCNAAQSYAESLYDVEFASGGEAKRQEVKRIDDALAKFCAEGAS
jgi:hypothetical protein